jgi:ATP-binding cassette subfamily B protein
MMIPCPPPPLTPSPPSTPSTTSSTTSTTSSTTSSTTPSSRRLYRQYRDDFTAHRTEGSRRTAAGHAEHKRGGAQRTFLQLFRAFLALLRGRRRSVAFSLLTVTIATGLKLIPPAATGFVLDYILGSQALDPDLVRTFHLPEDKRWLLALVALIVITASALSVGVGVWGRYVNTVNTKRLQSKLRRKVFDHAVRLPLHRVHHIKSGGAASMLREDAGGVAELLFSMLYNPWRAVIQLFATIIILATIDWRLLIGALLIVPIVYFTHRRWIGRIRPLWRDIRHTRQQVDAHAAESFGGMRVVRGFGRQRTETNRFIRGNHLMIRQEMLAWIASRSVEVVWAILIPAATAGLIFYGGLRVLDGAITTGELVMFLFYMAMLLEPLATLATSATSFQNSLAGLDRVLDLLEEPREFADSPGDLVLTPDRVPGRLTLSHVSFTYPESDRTVLHDIELVIPAGTTIALVGPSGAGKTTLCNLIARFYDPTHGTVALDGVDLRAINVQSYRRRLGIVEQDIFLHDGTIAQNIAYGRRHATMRQIEDAAEQAHATEFIDRLSDGYDSIIGERGVKLSGGQRQRIAIARALLADPRILILDEATSSLDTESERLIQDSLARLMMGRTSIVIAHRLSTIAHADLIVVLEGGRIIERGAHDDLMARSGRYRKMVQMQLLPPGSNPRK